MGQMMAGVRESADKGKDRERGAVLVEFAMISILFFTLLFGVIEFGYQFNDYQALRQGVREGARQATVEQFDARCRARTPALCRISSC